MKLNPGHHLAYVVVDEAWYTPVLKQHGFTPYGTPALTICSTIGGGAEWEFVVTEHDVNGGTIKVAMFAEAFDALRQVPEFFAFLVDQAPSALGPVREFLDSIGARDITERTLPTGVAPESAREPRRWPEGSEEPREDELTVRYADGEVRFRYRASWGRWEALPPEGDGDDYAWHEINDGSNGDLVEVLDDTPGGAR